LLIAGGAMIAVPVYEEANLAIGRAMPSGQPPLPSILGGLGIAAYELWIAIIGAVLILLSVFVR